MTSKIWACVCCYQEGDIIAQSLRSILPFIDGVILVDGALLGYPMPDDFSTDGTVERAKYVTKKEWNKEFVELHFHERRTEMDKRTLYLQYLQEHENWNRTWAFVWDADFFIAPFDGKDDESKADSDMAKVVQDFNIIREDETARIITIPAVTYNENSRSGVMNFCVGYRGIPKLHYTRTHYDLRDASDAAVKVMQHYPQMGLKNTMLKHLRFMRTKERNDIRGNYYSNEIRKYEV